MTKLTALQRETLVLIRDGKVHECNTGYGSWRIMGASPGVVGKLRVAGLVIDAKVDDRNKRFDITEAGAAAIA